MTEGAKELLRRGAAELGLHLDPDRLRKFATLATELRKWSRKINLTALRSDEDIALKHFVDSLTLAKVVTGRGSLLDLGSGGGFPALPLKILFPELAIFSVDAVEKKILFQRHAARILGLHNFTALHARGEELPVRYANQFDWVVSRAFSDLPSFVHLALPLINEHGTIIAMKGKGGRAEGDAARPALTDLGVTVREVVEFPLPVSGDLRTLLVLARRSG